MKEPPIIQMAREIIDAYEENLFLRRENVRLERENQDLYDKLMGSLNRTNSDLSNLFVVMLETVGSGKVAIK